MKRKDRRKQARTNSRRGRASISNELDGSKPKNECKNASLGRRGEAGEHTGKKNTPFIIRLIRELTRP